MHSRHQREQLEMRSRPEHAIADVDLELDRVKRKPRAIGASRKKLMRKAINLKMSRAISAISWTSRRHNSDEWDAFRPRRTLENTNEI
jgi:hypothetical protein